MPNKWVPSTRKWPDKTGAYAHWWKTKEQNQFPSDPDLPRPPPFKIFDARGDGAGSSAGEVSDGFYASSEAIPLPSASLNNNKPTSWSLHEVKEALKCSLPSEGEIEPDTVITGILDTGISLSHMSTNHAAGQTRILAAWQQGATMSRKDDGKGDEIQPWLPCGMEIFSGDINAALARNGDTQGVVDEIAFNRELNVSDPSGVFGNNDLEMAAAHGTHTLNLSAGYDPLTTSKKQLARQKIIAVNLPTQYAHGSGGNFLAYFAVYAVERIIYLADLLWEKKFYEAKGKKSDKNKPVMGFPIVINFSYGMVAGPKDGNHLFERALALIIKKRKRRAEKVGHVASPVRICIPAGNDNLEQGAASSRLGAQTGADKNNAQPEISLPWQVQPADSSANFLEIWSKAVSKADFDQMLDNLKVTLSPPDQAIDPICAFDDRTTYDLNDYARVYVRHINLKMSDMPPFDKDDKTVMHRLALLVCVGPTTSTFTGAVVAPAGTWDVRVAYDQQKTVDFTFYIQSDQSAVLSSKTALRSYFDHPAYRTHMTEFEGAAISKPHIRDENGRVADTYYFGRDLKSTVDNDNWLKFGPVQRRGSHNAISSIYEKEVIAVGAFDDSTGIPAPYSASTDGNTGELEKSGISPSAEAIETNGGRKGITLCYPGENAPSLFGILSAGSRDGSVVGQRGTSMATGLATREASEAFLDCPCEEWDTVATEAWFRKKARKADDGVHYDHWRGEVVWPPRNGAFLKIGSGRLRDPRQNPTITRLGGES